MRPYLAARTASRLHIYNTTTTSRTFSSHIPATAPSPPLKNPTSTPSSSSSSSYLLPTPLIQNRQSRPFSTYPHRLSAWTRGPSPPRLPKEEQEIFEQLQRQSTGAFSTPRPSPPSTSTTSTLSTTTASTSAAATTQTTQSAQTQTPTPAIEKDTELHPNVRRGAPPEFEGDTNPRTGEAGGPKNEPLRWGGGGDWSYNGRVSDF